MDPSAAAQQDTNAIVDAFGRGEYGRAHALAEALARNQPRNIFAWKAAAAAAQQMGRGADALRAIDEALGLAPGDPDILNFRGLVLRGLGRIADAEACWRAAIAARPDFADAHYNLGGCLMDMRRAAEAEACFRQALAANPRYEAALNALGNCLVELGRAADAEAAYRRALAIRPDYPEACNNLGNCLRDSGRAVAAEASYRKALALKPDFADAHNNLGNCLAGLGRLDEAEACYRRALALEPGFAAAFDNLLFALNYHPGKTAEEIRTAYADYDRHFGAPHRAAIRPHANPPAAGRRLKIGYVSPDFRQHSSRHFLEPLIANHDRAAFELFAYAELGREDAVTARYKTLVDRWIATAALDDDAMCARIRADGIDILVDLAGHTTNNRLGVFARKPAPVSLSWLGYASTTGLSAIDYLLIDPASAPPGSDHLFAETPWRLDTPAYVYRPAEGMGPEGPSPALRHGHVTFGTLTRAVRINDRTVRAWARILAAVPRSRLTVDSFSFVDPGACEALAARFEAAGIARDRLDIGHHSPPWDVLRGIDIGLDCFPHNSGVTLFETLYMGVPYVTLAGRPSVGLIGSSILEGAGHPEWIARTEDDYVDIAARLAGDLPALAALRAGLRAEMRSRPIMDERGFAARVEAAYRNMFEIWERGQGRETGAAGGN